jgi:hypothetical protein
MTARVLLQKTVKLKDDLILVLKKQTPTVKVITVRLKIVFSTLSLTLITLTVCVNYMAVFEYQKQVIINMTVFLTDGDLVVILKASHLQYDCFFDGW